VADVLKCLTSNAMSFDGRREKMYPLS